MIGYLAAFIGTLIGLGLLITNDVTHFVGGQVANYLFYDVGDTMRAPEYERAEAEWANGHFLDAIQMLRDFLKHHPRELHAALRIAEIYEKDLKNHVAAALEYRGGAQAQTAARTVGMGGHSSLQPLFQAWPAAQGAGPAQAPRPGLSPHRGGQESPRPPRPAGTLRRADGEGGCRGRGGKRRHPDRGPGAGTAAAATVTTATRIAQIEPAPGIPAQGIAISGALSRVNAIRPSAPWMGPAPIEPAVSRFLRLRLASPILWPIQPFKPRFPPVQMNSYGLASSGCRDEI